MGGRLSGRPFEKGNKASLGHGRRKGTPNKFTGLLREVILQAAEQAGGKEGLLGYLTTQAKENPQHFMSLLGRVLPLQLDHGVTGELAELLKAIDGRTRGIPTRS